jgi:CubicO group peptidase (beta-lactamase class C family)
MAGGTRSGTSDLDTNESMTVGRRGFIGAGLTTAGAAVLAPRASAAPPRAGAADLRLSPKPVDPTAQSLVPIPDGRVRAAIRHLDEVIKEVQKRTGVPGIAASVVHRGEMLYAKGFGVRDVRTGVPVNAQTVFHLASVSKSLSATVVARIVGRKRIEWDDPIIGHFPDFRLSDLYVTRNVTYADMFSHTSGLPEYAGDLLEELGYRRPYILHALRRQPLHAFRSQYAYTNFGLTAAGVAAASAAGGEWATVADELLFAPLRMSKSTYRYSQFVRELNRAAMHVRIDGKWVQEFTRNADPEAPAGGAHSNVIDLAKWMMLKLADGRWKGRELIAPQALLDADTPRSVSQPPASAIDRTGFYGFGVDVSYDYSGRLRLSHSGAFAQGAATNYVLLPDHQLGIVVLTNGMPIGAPEAIAQYFMDLVIGGRIENAWLDLYLKAFEALYVNPSKLAGKHPPAHPSPARANSYYVGTYENPYYGSIRVQERRSKLHVLIGPRPTDYELNHWNGNLFSFVPVGESALGISAATFTPGQQRAKSLTLEYYDTTGLGVFTRS